MRKLVYVGILILVGLMFVGCSKQEQVKPKQEPIVGDKIVIELNTEKAPKTVENFLNYSKSGFYEGTIFHRVMSTFMIQGGGLTVDMTKKEVNEPINNEANNGLSNLRGSIAMARTGDPHSATAQFFINVVDNDRLDFTAENPAGWGYCVFGKVIEGMDVVDKIRNVKITSMNGRQNVPVNPIVIDEVSVDGNIVTFGIKFTE